MLLLFVISFNACKKDDSTQHQNPKNLSNSAKVLNWINTQQANAKTEQHKNKYESLKNNINVNELWVEDIREGEKIILMPIKDGFEIKNNKNKPVTNYLFLIQDTKGEIQLGEIVQYLSEDKTSKTPLPYNALHKLYTFEPVSGQFTNLSILNTDYYLTETEYRNDKLYRTSVVKPKAKDPNATLPPAPGDIICVTTDWYEWTLITYSDGTTEYSEVFLYQTTVCSNNGGGGGGSGGGSGVTPEEDEAPYDRTAEIAWVVGAGIVGNDGWTVYSHDILKGIRPRNPAERAIFTSASHDKVSIIADHSCATYHELTWTINQNDEFNVTSANSGIVIRRGNMPNLPISKAQAWVSYHIWR